jgi:magnesium-transporting ATPase (P-type)
VEVRNMLLLLMVLFENVHIFNCRSETRSAFQVPIIANPFVVLSVIGALGIHVAVMYMPFMQGVLRVAPLAAERWIVVAVIALGLLGAMEIYKLARRRAAP